MLDFTAMSVSMECHPMYTDEGTVYDYSACTV